MKKDSRDGTRLGARMFIRVLSSVQVSSRASTETETACGCLMPGLVDLERNLDGGLKFERAIAEGAAELLDLEPGKTAQALRSLLDGGLDRPQGEAGHSRPRLYQVENYALASQSEDHRR